MTGKEWLADIGAAADELGYAVLEIRPYEVQLASLIRPDDRVIIESRRMSGKYLREVLKQTKSR